MSDGLCECGCGKRTNISPYSDAPRGYVKGQPFRYVRGHRPANCKADRYRVEDRGHSTPCWTWLLAVQSNGYGHITNRDYQGTAHRWYWIQENGEPPEGAHIDHLCRNRDCVNPAHMELVTVAENSRRGDNAVLTYEDVEEVKRLRARGLFQRVVAEQFGVSRQTISDIEHGRTWSARGGVIAHGA